MDAEKEVEEKKEREQEEEEQMKLIRSKVPLYSSFSTVVCPNLGQPALTSSLKKIVFAGEK